jgi:hypothetical protein
MDVFSPPHVGVTLASACCGLEHRGAIVIENISAETIAELRKLAALATPRPRDMPQPRAALQSQLILGAA